MKNHFFTVMRIDTQAFTAEVMHLCKDKPEAIREMERCAAEHEGDVFFICEPTMGAQVVKTIVTIE